MSKDGINSKDFIIGTLIGGIIGATTALFLAPKSGKQLREELNEQASAVLDKTEQWKNITVEKGTEFAHNTKEKTADYTSAVTEQSTQFISLLKDSVKQKDDPTSELLEEVEEKTSESDGSELELESEAKTELTAETDSTEVVQNMLKETEEALKKAESNRE